MCCKTYVVFVHTVSRKGARKTMHTPLDTLTAAQFETPEILKKVALASRKLAELKGLGNREYLHNA